VRMTMVCACCVGVRCTVGIYGVVGGWGYGIGVCNVCVG